MNPIPPLSSCAVWRFFAALSWPLALLCAAGMAGAQVAPAPETSLSPALLQQVRQLVMDKAATPGGPRVELQIGQLDARLRLAPCQKIEPYVPSGSRLRGASRVGLRCLEGSTRWNVYVPVTVSLFGPAVVMASDLPAGHTLQAADLRMAEVNLSESRSPPWTEPPRVLGRVLSHPVAAGQALRQDAVRPRQWFAAGETVQVRAVGGGFSIVGAGEALNAGMEGQMAKVRTESGKVITGMPVAERQLEVEL